MAMTSMQSVEPFLDSTSLLTDPASLRERARELGYLFFPALLDTTPIQAVRQQVLEICADHGWIEPGTDPTPGIALADDVVV